MSQKAKKSILILLIIAVIGGTIYLGNLYLGNKISTLPQMEEKPIVIRTLKRGPDQAQLIGFPAVNTIEGEVESIGEKQLYLKGNSLAINISAQVPVLFEDDTRVSNLSTLNVGEAIKIKVDEANNAIQIIIKK